MNRPGNAEREREKREEEEEEEEGSACDDDDDGPKAVCVCCVVMPNAILWSRDLCVCRIQRRVYGLTPHITRAQAMANNPWTFFSTLDRGFC